MFKTVGRYLGLAKSKMREFSREMEAAADDAGLTSIKSEIEEIAGSTNLIKAQGQKASSWEPLATATAPVVGSEKLDDVSEEVPNEKTELTS